MGDGAYYGMPRKRILGLHTVLIMGCLGKESKAGKGFVESRRSVLLGDTEPQQPPLYRATGFGNF